MRGSRGPVVGLVVAALLAGCATGGTGSGTYRDSRRITGQEIAEVTPEVNNLYQVVERLRPRWLEARSPRSMSGFTEIVVFQDQSLLGTVEELRQYGPEYAVWLEYLDASQAVSRLPGLSNRNIGGAIIIHLRPPRD